MKGSTYRFNSGSTLFLKIVICLFGLLVIGLCIFILPRGIMSPKAGAYLPILLGMYIPAIPFFIALYHGLKLLTYIDKKKVFSSASVNSLKYIKYCGFMISALYAAGMPYIFQVAQKDDAPGVAALGFIFIFASLAIATCAALFQRLLQNILDIKSENELTV
jgi:hypothetical protein